MRTRTNRLRQLIKLLLFAMASLILAALVGYVIIVPGYDPPPFPDGKRFAFTICDDTDEAALSEIVPVYELLDSLGLRVTKTVWVLPTNEPEGRANLGQTLADTAYTRYVLSLQERGFEIALHGARGGSSTRPEILAAMETYRDIIGQNPNIHINHFVNKDDLYWGKDRLTLGPLRWIYDQMKPGNYFYGHQPGSDYFWGDFVQEHVSYVVGFSFHETNILRANPLIPYHDPRKPYVNHWFSTSDGGDRERFLKLLSKENLDRLEEDGGACIVYTHLSKDFVIDGEVAPDVRDRLIDVASREGWFVPASQLLDHLLEHKQPDDTLDWSGRLYLELMWFIEKFEHGNS